MVRVRADIIDAYLFRRVARRIEVLQLRRATEPLKKTWQPVMGHVRTSETAVACLWRELREETGLTRRSDGFIGAWAMEHVYPYFMTELNAIVLSPRFAVEVSHGWIPRLNHEHDASRWVDARRPELTFMWPGQVHTVADIPRLLKPRGVLRVGKPLA